MPQINGARTGSHLSHDETNAGYRCCEASKWPQPRAPAPEVGSLGLDFMRWLRQFSRLDLPFNGTGSFRLSPQRPSSSKSAQASPSSFSQTHLTPLTLIMDLSTPRLKIDPQDKGEGTLEANGTTLEAKGSIPEWQPKANDTTTDKLPVHGRGQFKTNSYENNDQITDALKKWAETDPLYCSVCLPVTRDIGILTIPSYHPT